MAVLLHTTALSSAQTNVMISEFMASNTKTLADEDGEFSDWIEIYNYGTGTVDLTGWYLTDNAGNLTNWAFPAVSLLPKDYLVVFASTNNRRVVGSPFHTGFKLSAGGEYLALVKPDGATVISSFGSVFPEQYADISYGMGQSSVTNVVLSTGAVAKCFVPADGSLGSTWTQISFDDSGWTNGPTGIGYQTAVAGFAARNYKANVPVGSLAAAETVIVTPSQQSSVVSQNCSVINFLGTGGSAHYVNDSPYPGGTIGVDINNFVIEATAVITIPSAGYWTFGANTDDGFGLAIDSFSTNFPNGRGPADTMGFFNFPSAGNYNLRFVQFEGSGGSEGELFAMQGSNATWSTGFKLVGDTTSGGLAVICTPMPSGGESYKTVIATDVQSSMMDRNASIYLRVPFVLTNAATVESLFLRMKYDDGFVAYVNGQEVSRRNAPVALQWDSAATNSHAGSQALVFEAINISDKLGVLVDGTNILAVQGLNVSSNDIDFLIVPGLVEYKVQNLENYYFKTASPGTINQTGLYARVENVRFDIDRGLFSNALSVTMSTDTTNAQVRYTTDFTPPTTNSTLYTASPNITNTTVIRVDGYRTNFLSAGEETHSYIFYDDVLNQPTNPAGFTLNWNGTRADYGMDPLIVNDVAFGPLMTNALKSLPTLSLVTARSNLFDSAYGIYVNSLSTGDIWERPASVEWIKTNNTTAFAVNCGLRMQGGYFRNMSGSRKHSFRVLFKSEYGSSKLNYDVFDDPTAVTSFDTLVFRAGANDAWSAWTAGTGLAKRQYVADAFAKRSHRAMGGLSPHDTFVHLYLDGLYWGVYNVSEKPDQSLGAAYVEGDKDNWDVVVNNEAIEGDKVMWDALVAKCNAGMSNITQYQEIQGNNPDGSRNPAFPDYIDMDSYIDYLMIRFWVGDVDWPNNNWHAIRYRDDAVSTGFRFPVWDAEAGFNIWGDVNTDRTTQYNGVATPYGKLLANAEFRILFADHVYRHMFNGGALTTNQTIPRYAALASVLDPALVAESARWGDQSGTGRFTIDDWRIATNYIVITYLPQRPAKVLTQFKARGLYPYTDPPVFNQQGGSVSNGFALTMYAPSGTVYYTQNGMDPRMPGGSVYPGVSTYASPVILTDSVHVKARVLYGTTWSAINEASFFVIRSFTDLLVTEIMYNPPAFGEVDGDELEFIELKNASASEMDLSGVSFTNGIYYTFPVGTHLGAGQFVVLVSNASQFTNKYQEVTIGGVYTGRLANSGETIALAHASGTQIVEIAYTDTAPWPLMADGEGYSVVPVNANYNPNPANGSNWRASSQVGGSPGADDPAVSISPIWISEILAHTDPPECDSIELYNPNTNDVNIGHWYLTDNRTKPKKFPIPAGTVITSGTYIVFTTNDFNLYPGTESCFALSEYGEEVYLYSADASSNLTGYSDGFIFGASTNGGTFERYTISTGEIQYPVERANTIGFDNAGPLVGPVVMNEIQYHPVSGFDEFIELKNITSNAVPLYDAEYPTNTWKINGIGYVFPTNILLPANSYMLVVGGDPALFRTNNNVPTNVPVYGPYAGVLENNGEMVQLMAPGKPDILTNEFLEEYTYVPYIVVDEVRYNNKSPWPEAAAGSGSSLERISESAYGNDPINWRASPGNPSPGKSNHDNKAPVPNAGMTVMTESGLFPVNVPISGSVTDDGLPNPPAAVTMAWSQVSGTGTVVFAASNQLSTTVRIPVPGLYVLRMTANDSELQASDDLNVIVSHVCTQISLVATGSMWRYLDNGSNQGTNWILAGFDDSGWSNGLAHFGYGDGNEKTVVSYGPNSTNKYITTYFRRSVEVANASVIYNLVVKLCRDAGAVAYLNGVEIFRSNMPIGTITNLTLASWPVSGTDETMFFNKTVDEGVLVSGTNTLAVEVHQSATNNGDLSFDLELVCQTDPSNQVPVVSAGTNFVVTLPSCGTLKGAVTDDGLPSPPAFPSTAWSLLSGAGAIEVANSNMQETEVSFSATGTYVLCLSAYDGQFSSSNNVTVTVNLESIDAWKARYFSQDEIDNHPEISGNNADADLDKHTNYQEYIAGTDPRDPESILKVESMGGGSAVKVSFRARANRSYSLVYRDSMVEGDWAKLTDVPAQITTQWIEITDSTAGDLRGRCYRLVTPSKP